MLHDLRAWLVPALTLLLVGPAPPGPQDAGEPTQGPPSSQELELVRTLGEQGVILEPRLGLAAIDATVEVIDDLLEYLLVGPAGARHETAFTTEVRPSVLNVALLTLGAEPGHNARWSLKEPRPSDEEMSQGVSPYDITPPSGFGFYLYAGWRRGDEVYFFRVEDLVRDLATGQTMRRHRWIYLGSRMIPADPRGKPGEGGEEFAADVYQNLVNISWFSDGNTLLTGALEECVEQTIWMTNAWLLPDRGQPVLVVFSRERLERAPDALLPKLPDVGPALSPYELQARSR